MPDTHDPYKPRAANTQSNFYSPPTQPLHDPYKHTQSTYDPYKPPARQASPVHTTNDPYKPTAQTSLPAQSRSTPAYGGLNNYSNAYSKPPVPPVPAPPKVTAETFRTDTANAYDPPVLRTKTKRHASGWGSTMTTPMHASSLPLPSPAVSNTPLAPPPRKDSVSAGLPPRATTSSVGPSHRVESPANQGNVESPGYPPPPSRPSSRQVLRETGVSHLPPPPLSSSRQALPEPSVQSPQQHEYRHRRVDSPGLGTQRNWPPPRHLATSPEQSTERTTPHLERSEQNFEVSCDNPGHLEVSSLAANELPPTADAEASPGLIWDPEGGPSPSTALQSDYVRLREIGDAIVTDAPKPEQEPIPSSHSRASSYDRLYVNEKSTSPRKQTTLPHDPYKPMSPLVQQPPPTNQTVPVHTQATSVPHDPYKPTALPTSGSAPVPMPSSPPVNGRGSRPGSLRSSLESTRPYISQHDYTSPVRSSSPASIRSQPGNYISSALKSEYGSSHNPYAPSNRTRSATNGTVSSVASDAYTPHRQPNEAQDHPPHGSKFGYPDRPSSRTETLLVTSAYPTYAPSPSLLGTNDPLGRASARVPVISFGFGGKVVTCFHGADMSSAGFDVALSSRQSREIHVRSLHKLVPQSALEDTTVAYPGPLFGDPGSPTVSLVRGASTQAKTKKTKVVKYLEDRISELSSVVAYTSTGLYERGRSEGKLVLFSLLKVMVENDGKLSGT